MQSEIRCDRTPEVVGRGECSIRAGVSIEASSQDRLNLVSGANYAGLPLRAMKSDSHSDEEASEPDFCALVTFVCSMRRRPEPLVIQVVETVEDKFKQP